MERWTGRVALVTGASSGIGAGIARRLVTHGMKVIGSGRNIDSILKMADELREKELQGSLDVLKCDISNEDDILKMFEKIKSEFGRIDVLVNSAGLGHPSPILSGDSSKWREMLNVNVLGLCICTKEAYKLMKESGVTDGHIFLINSLSGHRIVPGQSNFYAATKHAVTALTEGIRNELRQAKSNIRISSISPGIVETEFWTNFYGNVEDAKNHCGKFQCLQTDDIADAVVYALGAPPHVQVHDILIRPVEQVS